MNATAPLPARAFVVSRLDPAGPNTWYDTQAVVDRHLSFAPEWASVLEHAYGHKSLYIGAHDGDRLIGVLPAIVVHRPVFGTVVSSMPFLDGGGPCGASSEVKRRLVARLHAEAQAIGAGVLDLRSAEPLDLTVEPHQHKVNMTVALPPDPDDLWGRLDGAVRNQVRKAMRAGLSVEVAHSSAVNEFYPVFCARMHSLGTPVHSRAFFLTTLAAFGDRSRVLIVRKGHSAIGGLIALAHGDTITVPWAACLEEHFSLCPNMLLYWEVLRTACVDGYRRFDFGRSTRDSGTYRFKRQWGATEQPLFWYRVPLSRSRTRRRHRHNEPGMPTSDSFLARTWRRMPRAVVQRVGPHIRKYLVQ
jgi:FemAB-related protein (PEP-CTERM system-associated)